MENKDALNSQMRGYIVDKQTKLSGKGQDEFVEKTSREFNQIRKSTDRTTRFRNELEMAKSLKAPTVHIIDDWVDDVEYYADKMHDFDKRQTGKCLDCREILPRTQRHKNNMKIRYMISSNFIRNVSKALPKNE